MKTRTECLYLGECELLRQIYLVCLILSTVFLSIPQTAFAQQSVQSEKTLKVITIERPPFSFISGDKYSGFSIDLWNAVAKNMGYRTEFITSSTFSGMLEAVKNDTADAAIANISITSAREEIIDFSHPIFDSGLQIMMRVHGSSAGILSALFTWQMFGWLAIGGLVLFAAATLMWFFERRSQKFFEQPYHEAIWPSFWWALNMVVNGGFEERIPNSWPGRIFAVLLVISSLFVVSIFVAKITATLTVGELRSSVQTLSDLHGKSVGTTSGSTSAAFLKENQVRFRKFNDINSLFINLENENLDAIVQDAPILAYYAQTDGKGIVRTVGKVFHSEKYGIALKQGSALIEPVNLSLLRLRENGTYQSLIDKWFGESYR